MRHHLLTNPEIFFAENFFTGAVSGTRAATPGPGGVNFVDTAGKLSILNHALKSASGTAASSNPLVQSANTVVQTKTPGLVMIVTAKVQNTGTGGLMITFNPVVNAVSYYSSGVFFYNNSPWAALQTSSIIYNSLLIPQTVDTYYTFIIVSRASSYGTFSVPPYPTDLPNGNYFFIKGGTEYPDWTFIGASSLDFRFASYPGGGYYASLSHFAGTSINAGVKNWRVLQLPGLWNGRKTFELFHEATPTSLMFFPVRKVSDGNGASVEILWTPSASVFQTIEMRMRYIDPDNYFIVRWNEKQGSSGGTVKVLQKTAGVEVELSSAAIFANVGYPTGCVAHLINNNTLIVLFGATWKMNVNVGTTFDSSTTAQLYAEGQIQQLYVFPRTLEPRFNREFNHIAGLLTQV